MAGQFLPQYEIYWKRLDPQDSGQVAPMDAAKFLKLSGLNDHTLGKVMERCLRLLRELSSRVVRVFGP